MRKIKGIILVVRVTEGTSPGKLSTSTEGSCKRKKGISKRRKFLLRWYIKIPRIPIRKNTPLIRSRTGSL
jgi:hypothetical protein